MAWKQLHMQWKIRGSRSKYLRQVRGYNRALRQRKSKANTFAFTRDQLVRRFGITRTDRGQEVYSEQIWEGLRELVYRPGYPKVYCTTMRVYASSRADRNRINGVVGYNLNYQRPYYEHWDLTWMKFMIAQEHRVTQQNRGHQGMKPYKGAMFYLSLNREDPTSVHANMLFVQMQVADPNKISQIFLFEPHEFNALLPEPIPELIKRIVTIMDHKIVHRIYGKQTTDSNCALHALGFGSKVMNGTKPVIGHSLSTLIRY